MSTNKFSGYFELTDSATMVPASRLVAGRLYYARPNVLTLDPREELKTSRDNGVENGKNKEKWAAFVEDIRQNGVQTPIFAHVHPETGEVLHYTGRQRTRAAKSILESEIEKLKSAGQEVPEGFINQLGNGNDNFVPVLIFDYQSTIDTAGVQIAENNLRFNDSLTHMVQQASSLLISNSPEAVSAIFAKKGMPITNPTDIRFLGKLGQVKTPTGKMYLVDLIENGKITFTKAKTWVRDEYKKDGIYDFAKIKGEVEAKLGELAAEVAASGTGLPAGKKGARLGQQNPDGISKSQLLTAAADPACPATMALLFKVIAGTVSKQVAAEQNTQLAFLLKVSFKKDKKEKAGKKATKAAEENPNPLA